MKVIIIGLILFNLIEIKAQVSDTLFLDRKWEPIKAGKHKYYRLTTEDGLYKVITDYYKEGSIQSRATFLKESNGGKSGLYVWYNEKGVKTKEILYDIAKYPEYANKILPDSLQGKEVEDYVILNVDYFKNGKLASISYAINECTPHGYLISYYEKYNGFSIFTNVGGIKEGPVKEYDDKGKILWSGNYKQGKKDGEFYRYDNDGEVWRIDTYYNGAVISKKMVQY